METVVTAAVAGGAVDAAFDPMPWLARSLKVNVSENNPDKMR